MKNLCPIISLYGRGLLLGVLFLCICPLTGLAWQNGMNGDSFELENPISVPYLKKNLHKSSPRLVLNDKIEKDLKRKLRRDPVVQNMYAAIKLNAEAILEKPLLERTMRGRRLLHISRDMLYRMNILGMVYRMEEDPAILQRINEELIAVCQFSDWNPSHFLDVAEMAMAVALGLDWTAGELPESTEQVAREALIEMGIKPSFREEDNSPWWVSSNNNWNQVCHGGMIAAAIVIAEDDPELAARTIGRALDFMPYALDEYGPDGVYPEGSTYWGYGTGFSVVTAAMFESAFDTDFGLSNYPAFMESADFRVLCNSPSGGFYNFADCGDQRNENGDLILAWFAAKTGNEAYFEEERFLHPAEDMGELSRYAGMGLVWLSQFEATGEQGMPIAWKGEGPNPIVIFKGAKRRSEPILLWWEGRPRQYKPWQYGCGVFRL